MVAPLAETLRRQGEWLFRNRSWVPLLLLPIVVTAIFQGPVPDFVDSLWWQLVCWAWIAAGLVLRGWVVGQVPEGTSGRNTREQIAEQLNTTGPYSLVRHPLYVANAFLWSGILLRPGIWWLWLVGMGWFVVVYERIMLAEEAFLLQRFGDSFQQWAAQTPAVLLHAGMYRPSARAFQWKKLVFQEYSTWLAVLASYTLLEGMLTWRQTGDVELPELWGSILGIAVCGALLVRLLKRYSAWRS
ncbi:MAG: isoprenylcysteine carboxylmethyltransferase family protein [Chlorobiota bacterium]